MARLDDLAVLVEWHDAHSEHSWTDLVEIDADPYVVRSVGWKLDVKPGHVTIAQSIADDGSLADVLHIPAGMVVRIIALGHPPR